MFLEDWGNKSMFEGGGERTREEREVYDGGNRMEKGRKAGFKEPGGD